MIRGSLVISGAGFDFRGRELDLPDRPINSECSPAIRRRAAFLAGNVVKDILA